MYKLAVNSQYREELNSKYFPFVLSIFSATWLISVISAVKIVKFMGITLTGGFIIFPITAALNSLIVDVYGFKGARQAIWCGTIVNLIYVFFINLVDLFPASPHWLLQSEFRSILVPQSRLIIASIIGFWASGFLNTFIMAKLKIKGMDLIFRIFVASVAAITLDISIYFLIGFLGVIPISDFKQLFFFAYFKKIIFEILLLPIVWKLIDIFKKLEGFEIYDVQTKFTPFSLDNVYKFEDYRDLKTKAS